MAASSKKLVMVGLFLVIAIMGLEPLRVSGQASMCGMTAQGLTDCRPSVNGQQPQVPPTRHCCSALSGANLQCLCNLRGSYLLTMYNIDPKQAMALPVQCNIVDPSWHC